MYKKTEFEKKSTRERYRIERGELYFRKRSGSTPYIFFAGAILLGLYAYWGGGPLYYVVAALFAGIGVWQFFYTRSAGVTAAEVDERMEAMGTQIDLEVDALNASDMDYDEFMEAPKIRLYGYSGLSIGQEEAILRADQSDDTARSSHLMFTCFILGEETLEAYSTIRSLLGDEKTEEVMEWRYDQLQAGLERVAAKCAMQPGGEQTETRKFPAVSIRCSNKRNNRLYTFCENCRPEAQELIRRIQEKKEAPRKETTDQ